MPSFGVEQRRSAATALFCRVVRFTGKYLRANVGIHAGSTGRHCGKVVIPRMWKAKVGQGLQHRVALLDGRVLVRFVVARHGEDGGVGLDGQWDAQTHSWVTEAEQQRQDR